MKVKTKNVITICATNRFAHALVVQARRVQAAMVGQPEGQIILVGDNSDRVKAAVDAYHKLMPEWNVQHVVMDGIDDENPVVYKEQAMLYLGQMRTEAFSRAIQLDAEFTWSLDSDVLPPENAYRCMLWALHFDDATNTGQHGLYGVATCPYPNLQFIGGRGTEEQPILPDFYEDERIVPDALKKELEKHRARLVELKAPDTPEKAVEWDETCRTLQNLETKMRECPPKGNVFECNSKGWRPRGWLEAAYPAIGFGSMVPIDWTGFGCNLLNKKALALCQFDGYAGQGTEDLYINWHRWKQAGVRSCAIPHCLCCHVKRNPGYKNGENSEFVLVQAYHETRWPMVGHIRTRMRPFYDMHAGEKFDAKNDGKFLPPKDVVAEKPVMPPDIPIGNLPKGAPLSPQNIFLPPVPVNIQPISERKMKAVNDLAREIMQKESKK